MILVIGSATVYSLFIKPLDVGAIGNDQSLAFLTDIEPVEVEEVKEKKDKDDAGGGGGGGREAETPASRGDLADQTKNPIRPPDAKVPRLDNPSLVLPPPSTEGNMKFEKKYNKWGLPNGLDGLTALETVMDLARVMARELVRAMAQVPAMVTEMVMATEMVTATAMTATRRLRSLRSQRL
jgi:hypothetical protein